MPHCSVSISHIRFIQNVLLLFFNEIITVAIRKALHFYVHMKRFNEHLYIFYKFSVHLPFPLLSVPFCCCYLSSTSFTTSYAFFQSWNSCDKLFQTSKDRYIVVQASIYNIHFNTQYQGTKKNKQWYGFVQFMQHGLCTI